MGEDNVEKIKEKLDAANKAVSKIGQHMQQGGGGGSSGGSSGSAGDQTHLRQSTRRPKCSLFFLFFFFSYLHPSEILKLLRFLFDYCSLVYLTVSYITH